MKRTLVLKASCLLILVQLPVFLLLNVLSGNPLKFLYSLLPKYQSVRRRWLDEALGKSHRFVPAHDPDFDVEFSEIEGEDSGLTRKKFVGRWTPAPDHLRFEAGFQGSCIDFSIQNSSSLYIALYNAETVETKLLDRQDRLENQQKLVVHPLKENSCSFGPVTLAIQINGTDTVLFNGSAYGIIQATSDLEKTARHSIRIFHLGGIHEGQSSPEILQFQGVWVDKGAYISSTSNTTALLKSKDPSTHLPSSLYTASNSPTQSMYTKSRPLPERKVIELVTSSTMKFLRSDFRPQNTSHLRMMQPWPLKLPRYFNISGVVLIPVTSSYFEREAPISSSFFRSGPPGIFLHGVPWPFSRSYRPMALILQLEINDVVNPSPSAQRESEAHRTDQATISTFIKSYIDLLRTIRSHDIYPDPVPMSSALGSPAVKSMPVFLLPPFYAWLATDERSLQMSRALHGITETVRKEEWGQMIFDLDTSGWLSPLDGDFDGGDLSPQAQEKIAMYLAWHLCPYIADSQDIDEMLFEGLDGWETGNGACPFNKYERYSGNVYVPEDAELEKVLEERKINGIMEAMGFGGGE